MTRRKNLFLQTNCDTPALNHKSRNKLISKIAVSLKLPCLVKAPNPNPQIVVQFLKLLTRMGEHILVEIMREMKFLTDEQLEIGA